MTGRRAIQKGIITSLVVLSTFGGAIGLAVPRNLQQTFDSIYGQSVKSAVSPAQKVALAQELLKEAVPLRDEEFQAFLFQKAFDLASSSPSGYSIAISAMDALAKARPMMKLRADQQILSIIERQSRTGSFAERREFAEKYLARLLPVLGGLDDNAARPLLQKSMPVAELGGRGWVSLLDERLKEIRQRDAARKTVAELEDRIVQNSLDQASALELVQVLGIDLDEPGEALSYAKSADTTTRQYLELAAKSPNNLSEDELIRTGEWYKARSATPDSLRKATALACAKMYFDLFLNKHSAEDATRLRAKVALKEVDAAIAASSDPSSPIVDLMSLIDARRDALTGTWTLREGKLSTAVGPSSRLLIPYQPPAEYDLRVTFERSDATAEFITFPVANRRVCWLCSCWDSVTSGFEMVDGKDARTNPTSRKLPETNKPGPHTVEIRVRANSIAAFLDGSLVIRYMTNGSDLSAVGPSYGPYALGLATGNAVVPTTFSRLDLFEISGKGHILRHPR